MCLPFGYAYAHRDVDASALELESRVPDQAVDLARELFGPVEANLRRDQCELLPADACQHIVDPQSAQ